MFDLQQFVADCRLALAEDQSHKSVREVVARAVSDPSSVLKGLGEPRRAEVQKLYQSEDLTILNVIWGPRMTIMPHNHQMWAVIGVYTGREDNILWRRIPGGENGKLEAAGARALCEKDAEPLGRNIIHSVTNPISRRARSLPPDRASGDVCHGVLPLWWQVSRQGRGAGRTSAQSAEPARPDHDARRSRAVLARWGADRILGRYPHKAGEAERRTSTLRSSALGG